MNITEEDLKNAEKELEDFIKEEDEKKEKELEKGEVNDENVENIMNENITTEAKKTK